MRRRETRTAGIEDPLSDPTFSRLESSSGCYPHQPPQHRRWAPASVLAQPSGPVAPAPPGLLQLLHQRHASSGALLVALWPELHPGAGRSGKLLQRGSGRRGEGSRCWRAWLPVRVHSPWWVQTASESFINSNRRDLESEQFFIQFLLTAPLSENFAASTFSEIHQKLHTPKTKTVNFEIWNFGSNWIKQYDTRCEQIRNGTLVAKFPVAREIKNVFWLILLKIT